jgi:hypothetical protein
VTTLFRPEAFEPLTSRTWDESWVRAAVTGIVADIEDAYDPAAMWPAEEWDSWQTPTPLKALFVGAAGVAWGLAALARRGHAECSIDLAATARNALDAWRAEPDFIRGFVPPSPARAALLAGETGILTAAWQLSADADIADTLFERVIENAENEANELMWGSPGTMLAARAMHEWTGEARWRDAWHESADALLACRDSDGLWTQRLDGKTSRALGSVHGLGGNVLALLGGDLDSARRAALISETISVLERCAVWEDGLVNWPGYEGRDLVRRDGGISLQWCHGAPGIVVSTAPYLPEEFLLPAAELTWRAGPHGDEKGAGICHGTAGNGYALLKTFAHTGDEVWLERARAFAVHALEQAARLRAQRGSGRYSLWTGDVGVAIYAADCLDAKAAYPIFDSWD